LRDTGRDLHPLEQKLLAFLEEWGPSSDTEIMEKSDLPDEGSFRRAAQWLLSRDLIREVFRETETTVEFGPVGQDYVSHGTTPELKLCQKYVYETKHYTTLSGIQKDPTFLPAQWGSAYGALLKDGTIAADSEGYIKPGDRSGYELRKRIWHSIYEPLMENQVVAMVGIEPPVRDYVTSRSPKRGKSKAEFTINEEVHVTIEITEEGSEALKASRGTAAIGAVTPEILADGSWREARFREYQVDIPPSRIHMGRLHPYRQFLDTVRRKFTSMGFVEMRGSMAESEFWNNDALFMPQFHPARDIHDAYVLEDGAAVDPPEDGLLEAVARVHETGEGVEGSRGWDYAFDRTRAASAILRSQGTALSARCLASGPEIPGKYFAIARCFRYDQVDSTHLPDFFQVEGIVLSEETDLRRLLGLLRLFAVEVAGAEEYRFTPSYFPFTEPSVELHVRHPGLGWMELGGAGLFREEVCSPLGVDVPVIAWGLGLDRMAMLALELDDIRDLFTADLARLRRMASRPDKLMGSGRGVTG
jgi:phenylalanyl-tRNA synthetase alpha chain